MSALERITDSSRTSGHVRKVPTSDILATLPPAGNERESTSDEQSPPKELHMLYGGHDAVSVGSPRMLRARYFPDFAEGPTLLFWGNADGMRHLIAMLEKLPPTAGSEFLMSGFVNDAPKLVLRSAIEPRGMQKQ